MSTGTEFKKLITMAVIISIVSCCLFVFGLMLMINNDGLFNTDYMPAMKMGIYSLGIIAVLSIFITVMIAKIFKSLQDELSFLRVRISELEKKINKDIK